MKSAKTFSSHTGDNINHAMTTVWRPQIHLQIVFSQKLDVRRLQKALRLCLDAEPVLGSKYVIRSINPHWQRMSKKELDSFTLLKECNGNTDSITKNFDNFLATEMKPQTNPQLCAIIGYDKTLDAQKLLIKINHQVVDAGGTKEFAYLLCDIYNRLLKNPEYQPQENTGSRSLYQVFKRFSFLNYFGILGRYFKDLFNNFRPYKSLQYLMGNDISGTPEFVFLHLDEQRTKSLKAFASTHNCTINDMAVTALFRAVAKQVKWNPESGQALRMICTIDLRRYLDKPHGESLCNLSSFFFPYLGFKLGETFEDTLKLVTENINKQKKGYLGLGFTLGSYLALLPYPQFIKSLILRHSFKQATKSDNMPIGLTNLGEIKDYLLHFDDSEIISSELIVPACTPPHTFFGLSGFKNTLTFSAGIYNSAINRKTIADLFELIDSELDC